MFTFACVRCSERKVKCNRQKPCSACTKHNAQCTFRAPKPPRRRQKPSRNESLDERLKHYETLLLEKGIDPNQVTNIPQAEDHHNSNGSEVTRNAWAAPTTSTNPTPQETVFKPVLLHEQQGTRFINNNLWLRVAEEIQDSGEAPEEEESAYLSSVDEASQDGYAYVLGWGSRTARPLHPPAGQIHQLWQIFIERVDPLLKLVHVPSLQLALERAATNVDQIPKGFEALMFAIYSLAVVSITEGECVDLLGKSRAIMLPSFVAATKAALSRANFMSSTSNVVLQALVLHIFSIRDSDDPRAVWSLTGLALRVAEAMGMRIDGTLLGLSPFETEMRRRIWWQLTMHDSRAAEMAGQAKFRDCKIDETTPKKPANVNDSDLSPTMRQAPREHTKPTEMMWSVLRADLATFAHARTSRMRNESKSGLAFEEYAASDDLRLKDRWTHELEDFIETKYLRFCDPSQPLHFMTLVGARLSLSFIRFTAHHPRRWAKLEHVPAFEQEFVWTTVMQLLEQFNTLQSSPHLRCFAWIAPYFIQWHAVIHVLDILQANPLHPDAEKAWRLINALYQNNPEMLLSVRKPIVAAFGNLCLKAFSARASTLAGQKTSLADPPEYITKLRELREAARSRAKKISASKGSEPIGDGTRMPRSNAETTRLDTRSRAVDARLEASRQQRPLVQEQSIHVPEARLTEDDAFWLDDALGDATIVGGAIDMIDIDMDTILAGDSWLGNSTGDNIDWGQWDALFGGLDSSRPNVGKAFE